MRCPGCRKATDDDDQRCAHCGFYFATGAAERQSASSHPGHHRTGSGLAPEHEVELQAFERTQHTRRFVVAAICGTVAVAFVGRKVYRSVNRLTAPDVRRIRVRVVGPNRVECGNKRLAPIEAASWVVSELENVSHAEILILAPTENDSTAFRLSVLLLRAGIHSSVQKD